MQSSGFIATTGARQAAAPVSYTHLDVYKRQISVNTVLNNKLVIVHIWTRTINKRKIFSNNDLRGYFFNNCLFYYNVYK